MTYINSRPVPSRLPGCASKLLILALFGAVTFVVLGGGRLFPAGAAAVGTTPATVTATIRPVSPELSSLAITQAALDIEGTQLAYHGTELANLAVEAQVTQQARIFQTQLARDGIHQAMTETTEAQQTNRAALWVQETDTILQSNAQLKTRATQTAEAWQSTAAVATQAEIVGRWNIAQNRRSTAERLAGVETILWRIIIPLAVAVCICLVAGGFTTMLSRRYTTPQAVEPEVYQPDEIIPEDDPLKIIPFTRVMVPSHTGNSGRWVEIEVWPEKLTKFAAGITERNSEAERNWTGSKGIFSLSEYDKMRDSMILTGLGRWDNPAFPKQGWSLSLEGRSALGLLARPTDRPTAVSVVEMA